jgi:RNA polymerase sigma-70 factor (ECF subfamily)
MDDWSDERLMESCGAGRHDAFEILVRRHQSAVHSMILRFTSRSADAEDLSQEVFLSCYRAAPAYRPEARFKTWLYRIVVNACLNYRKKVRPRLVEGLDSRPGPTPPPDQAAASAEACDSIEEAVQSLPENQRMALLLSRFEGFSYREIAQIMGATLPAVESYLHRAYETLREKLRAGFQRARC